MPSLYIIGGANGSGKTTVAMRMLPNFLQCFEYVNADIIAAGLSKFNPETVAIEAGRIMLWENCYFNSRGNSSGSKS
jgi:predicted ABC-type ATPase